ncbi:hypothetical protein BO70DRAFT_405378 [Aspergillus heteromorphus CBS 117.55]|uniref:Uncharacterized protein n=1 Tax=Aspergillus heteromorphus CBS 117.55 TaxID=1448321 RepID=A0A317W698_9EURO|nr:uncharacterized protein BO70DRAFT_405378 [Aspergillus heteromorphus CBS 117.55]PWY82136.1 hypothetical protein BO70DRAFT_405378 [Aspergillus heteromorphus CBS 117.55]
MSLTGIICTARIPLSTLATILTTAYAKNPNYNPTLVILASDTCLTLQTLQSLSSDPPSPEPFISPFLGMSNESAVFALRKIARETAVQTDRFFVADERTIRDGTLLLVDTDRDERGELRTVRVAGEEANVEAVCRGGGGRSVADVVVAMGG